MKSFTIPKSTLQTCLFGFIVMAACFFGVNTSVLAQAPQVFLSVNGSGYFTIESGDEVVLSWEVYDASNCSIDNGVGAINNSDLPIGSINVTPPASQTTLYTMTCGGESSSVIVYMRPNITLDATPNPTDIAGGASAETTFSWSSEFATECPTLSYERLSGESGTVDFSNATAGNLDLNLTETTTYILTCRNSSTGVSNSERLTVEVTDGTVPPPTISPFTVTPSTVTADADTGAATVSVRFSTKYATQCSRTATVDGVVTNIPGWSNANPDITSASYDLTLFHTVGNVSFELECQNGTGATANGSDSITVNAPAGGFSDPSVTIGAPNEVDITDPVAGTVSVDVTPTAVGADTCDFTARREDGSSPTTVTGWTNRSSVAELNTTYPVTLTRSVYLDVTCSRSSDGLSDSASHFIQVNPLSAPDPTIDFNASSLSVTSDPSTGVATVVLDWSSEHTSYCHVAEALPENGARYSFTSDTSISGSVNVNVYMDTRFVMACGRTSDDSVAIGEVSVSFSGNNVFDAGVTVTADQCYQMAIGSVVTMERGTIQDDEGFCTPETSTSWTYDELVYSQLDPAAVRPQCPLNPGPGRILIVFEDYGTRSTGWQDDAKTVWSYGDLGGVLSASQNGAKQSMQEELDTPIPAGSYAVTLVAWDGYEDRNNSMQPEEIIGVKFYDRYAHWNLESVGLQATSGSTEDLADYAKEAYYVGLVDEDLLLPVDITHLRTYQPAFQAESYNSVVSICMALDGDLPTVTIGAQNATLGGAVQTDQLTIDPGDEVSIEWEGEAADECVAVTGAGFSTDGDVSGVDTDVVEPENGFASLFTVRCSNPNGTVSDSVLVNSGAPLGTVTIEADKRVVRQGEQVELYWEVDPIVADMCTLTGGEITGGTPDFSAGSGTEQSTAITNERTYTLDCGVGGSDSVIIRALPRIIER